MKKYLHFFNSMKNQPYFWFYLALLPLLGAWGYFMWASYGHLPDTVEALKKEVALLKMAPDSAANSAVLDLQRLDLKIDRVETEIRKDFFLIQKLGLPLTVIAFALMFWSVYKSALGFALQKAKETVDRYYLPDEERFKREKKTARADQRRRRFRFYTPTAPRHGLFIRINHPDQCEATGRGNIAQNLGRQ